MALFQFLFVPKIVFEKIKSKPRWMAPFLTAVIGLTVKTYLNSAWQAHSIVLQYNTLYFYILSATIFVVTLWTAISAFLFLLICLLDQKNDVGYKQIFSLVSFCGIIFLLGECCNLVLIHTIPMNRTASSLPGQFPMGLDVLTLNINLHPALIVFLHAVNPFSLWYFTFLSIGLSVVAGMSNTKARMMSFVAWLIAVGLAMSVTFITDGTSLRIKV